MGIFTDWKKPEPSPSDLTTRLNQYLYPTPQANLDPRPAPPMYEAPGASPAPVAVPYLPPLVGESDEDDTGELPPLSPLPLTPAIPATNQFHVASRAVDVAPPFVPGKPLQAEDTGLPGYFLTELVIRTLHYTHEVTGGMLADRIALPFAIVAPILEALRREQAVEVRGQRGLGDAGFVYAVTEKGTIRARDSMETLTYVGPAPVPLAEYIKSVCAQSVRGIAVTEESIRRAFHDLIVDDSVLDEVGPAVNSGSSLFLFGYPGNGKTSIAERITALLGDHMYIPYAVEVDGAVINLYDPITHIAVEDPGPDGQPRRPSWDARWVRIERPVVMVGGELTMSSLDLLYNEGGKYYEAPLQMKANGGMFLIDDFGRQQIRPQDLLNRWIVPLEKRVDYLSLHTGKKVAIPFEQLIVFSTNLDPCDLVDDAFLRRIKFKINVKDPDEGQYRAIFKLVCERRHVPFEDDGFRYLLDTYYRPMKRPLRMCHPRDLIDQITAIAKYKSVPAAMTPQLIDRACQTYFVAPAA